MKKIIFIIFVLAVYIISGSYIFAGGDDYTFSLDYEGEIVVDEQKSGSVTLEGVDSPVQSNVIIKVDITGPATPEILATDSAGVEHDIAKLGYWGPETGFTVGGTFKNETPIKATFKAAGSYEISLSLVDANSSNTEYARNTFTVTVANTGDESQDDNQAEDPNGGLTDGNEELEEVQKLPQTGNYNIIYISIAVVAIVAIAIFIYIRNSNKS